MVKTTLWQKINRVVAVFIDVIYLLVYYGRPSTTMDTVSATVLMAGKQFIENISSHKIKLITLLFYYT
jgi:hypothetical protein